MSSNARKRVNAAIRMMRMRPRRVPRPMTPERLVMAQALAEVIGIEQCYSEPRFESKHWVEDIEGDERPYIVHTCASCGRGFMGHDARILCKLCAPASPSEVSNGK